jgi:hypothetical protein
MYNQHYSTRGRAHPASHRQFAGTPPHHHAHVDPHGYQSDWNRGNWQGHGQGG